MRLVAVAGADGAGKSTVTSQVASRLADTGLDVRRVERWDIVGNARYPAARFLDHDVTDIRSCVADMPEQARFLFLMWSLEMALAGQRDACPDRGIVLVDGYWMKHAAAEIAYGLDRDWVEGVVGGLRRPALTVHLRLDPARAWQRKQNDLVPYECGMDPACSPERFLDHQRAIESILLQWSARQGWLELDADRPVEEVVSSVVAAVLETSGCAREDPPATR